MGSQFCLPCSCGSFSFWPPNHIVASQVEDCVSRLGGNKLQEFLNSEEPEELFSCKSSEMLLNNRSTGTKCTKTELLLKTD